MTKESNEVPSEAPSEVECLFCGQLTPAPVLVAVRRSPGGAAESRFRVSIIRCHRCGKEAPYPAAKVMRRGRAPKSKHSSAA